MELFRKLFIHSSRVYIVAVILTAAFTGVTLIQRETTGLLQFADALSAGGLFTVLFGLLLLVTFFGGFDTFAFSFQYILGRNRQRDMYEYVTEKKEKRSHTKWYFMPFITVGLCSFLISLILGALAK